MHYQICVHFIESVPVMLWNIDLFIIPNLKSVMQFLSSTYTCPRIFAKDKYKILLLSEI